MCHARVMAKICIHVYNEAVPVATKVKMLCARVPVQSHQRLKIVAVKRGLTMEQVVNAAVLLYLKRKGA